MSIINVSKHHGSNYFTTAKNAVFGECAYVQGTQYKELQNPHFNKSRKQ